MGNTTGLFVFFYFVLGEMGWGPHWEEWDVNGIRVHYMNFQIINKNIKL